MLIPALGEAKAERLWVLGIDLAYIVNSCLEIKQEQQQ